MALIALRNPQFKSILIPSGVLSVSLDITINTVLIYRIVKNVAQGETASFDISEISRDYLNITYASGYGAQTVAINTVITKYSGANATGTIVGSAVNSSDTGVEAYGTFLEGVNPTLPFLDSTPTWLISKNYSNNIHEIFVPENTSGTIPYIYNGGQGDVIGVVNYSSADDEVDGAPNVNTDVKINRINCTKYGVGTKVIFINKFGVQQDLWFFLKSTKKLNKTSTDYSSNTLILSGGSTSYGLKNASKKIFNTQAKQSQTLSSGFYPEFAVEYFEQLLLSEYVWIERTIEANGNVTQVPAIVKSSSIEIKKSVNDRLIEYTIEFEDAFDYINNIR